jgi:hypothetical protein
MLFFRTKKDKSFPPDLIRQLVGLPDSLVSLWSIQNLLCVPLQNVLEAHKSDFDELPVTVLEIWEY